MSEQCYACGHHDVIPRNRKDIPLCRRHWYRYLIAWANYEVSGGAHVIRKQDR